MCSRQRPAAAFQYNNSRQIAIGAEMWMCPVCDCILLLVLSAMCCSYCWSLSKPPRLWEGSFVRSARNWRIYKSNPIFPLIYIVIMLWDSREQWSPNFTPPVGTKSFKTSYMLYILCYNKVNKPILIQIIENPNLKTVGYKWSNKSLNEPCKGSRALGGIGQWNL